LITGVGGLGVLRAPRTGIIEGITVSVIGVLQVGLGGGRGWGAGISDSEIVVDVVPLSAVDEFLPELSEDVSVSMISAGAVRSSPKKSQSTQRPAFFNSTGALGIKCHKASSLYCALSWGIVDM
jgi:hypothetical protein